MNKNGYWIKWFGKCVYVEYDYSSGFLYINGKKTIKNKDSLLTQYIIVRGIEALIKEGIEVKF